MKFSILIPTRDRPELVSFALRSALDQQFDDYEVVVSNNGSAVATRDAVLAVAHPRVRYVETESPLSMVDHWEWATRQVAGEWVILLADDDAMLPHCLRVLDAATKAHTGVHFFQFAKLQYYYDDGVSQNGNRLHAPAVVDRGFEVIDAAVELRRFFRTMRFAGSLFPWICVRRDLLDEVRAAYGAVFHPWAPDVSSGLLLLANTGRYCRIRQPLGIAGKNMKSFGSGSHVAPARLREFLRQFPGFDGTLAGSPYPDLIVVANVTLDTMYIVKRLLGRGFEDLEVDPVIMREKLLRDVARYLERGHSEFVQDARRLRRDLARALVGSPRGIWRIVAGQVARRMRTSRPGGARKAAEPEGIVAAGRDADFSNIYEAGRYYTSARPAR